MNNRRPQHLRAGKRHNSRTEESPPLFATPPHHGGTWNGLQYVSAAVSEEHSRMKEAIRKAINQLVHKQTNRKPIKKAVPSLDDTALY